MKPTPILPDIERLPDAVRLGLEDGLRKTRTFDAFCAKKQAELTLHEQEAHGELGVSPEMLRNLRDISARRLAQLAAEIALPMPAQGPPPASARFCWRAPATLLLLAGASAALLHLTDHLTPPASIGLSSVAGVALVAPWPRHRRLVHYLRHLQHYWITRHQRRETTRLRATIRRLDADLHAALVRRQQADAWVAVRMQIIRSEYEIHRLRAERAACRLPGQVPTDNALCQRGVCDVPAALTA